ncbi:MAG TPA: hypothetical protein VM695_06255 [Phycisphaerae bacterium]|nr:hypothetical protein [Phycisphaerae bacterium]
MNQKVSVQELIEAAKQHSSECLHPAAGTATCAGGPVQAHSVREPDLRRIARAGHVYALLPDFREQDPRGYRVPPKLIGVRRASTFTGFCSKHDAETFARIEREEIVPDREQAFLLTYRALCREVWASSADLPFLEVALDHLERDPEAVWAAARATEMVCHVTYKHIWYDGWKSRLDRMLLCGEYRRAGYFMAVLDECPPFLCAGWAPPIFDFAGRFVQSLQSSPALPEYVALSVLPHPSGGLVALTWVGEPQGASSRLAQSLNKMPQPQILRAVMRFALAKTENLYFNPDWWEALAANERNSVLEMFNIGIVASHREMPGTFLSGTVPRLPCQVTRTEIELPE